MELQDREPHIPIGIDVVGFKGIVRRLRIRSGSSYETVDAVISLYVDVDSRRRGVHLSRSAEALLDVIDELSEGASVEELLDSVASKLLERHNYVRRAVVEAEFVYYVPVEFNRIKGVEPVNVEVRVEKTRSGERAWGTAVSVKGITVCPSAKETSASILGLDLSIAPSHMQRVIVRGRVTTRGSFVDARRIAKALFQSVSAPTFTLLKRVDEAALVIEAHRRPMLIEDVAREALVNIAKELEEFEDDVVVEVEVESFESIHPHNLYAYKRALLGELRALRRSTQS